MLFFIFYIMKSVVSLPLKPSEIIFYGVARKGGTTNWYELCISYIAVCPTIQGVNPRALASGLSPVKVYKP